MAEPTRTAIRKWVALLDAAEHLRTHGDPHDPCAMKRCGMAIDSLFRYEHTLTAAQREAARRFLWERDSPDPLPPDTTEWQNCRCAACTRARRLARLRQTYPALTGAADTSTPPHPTTQGELFS